MTRIEGRTLAVLAAIAAVTSAAGCQGSGESGKGNGATVAAGSSKPMAALPDSPSHDEAGGATSAKPVRSRVKQVPLPDPLKQPPADAVKTAQGFSFKKIVSNDAGAPVKRNDMLLVNYTGWKLPSGETFFTTAGRGQPAPVSLAQLVPGFTDALMLMKQGEKADVWVPPEVGYRDKPMPPEPETLVYEVEVIEVTAAPAIPADVAAPPATARTLAPANVRYELLHPGSGTAPRAWDTIAFEATEWDGTGRMLETTEMRKLPASSTPFRQPRVVGQVLSAMTPGERVRFWTDADQLAVDGQPLNGVPKGTVCFELELRTVVRAKHDPPATPGDVAKPPADAKPTQLGVYYKVLKSGAPGTPHPGIKDSVLVRFSGWRSSDGTLFDTTAIKEDEKPAEVPVDAGAAGWSDILQHMVAGDHWRVWIPAELAFKGAPGKPQGMLVFDLELVSITSKSS